MKVWKVLCSFLCVITFVLLMTACGVTVTPDQNGGINITPTPGEGTQTPHMHAYERGSLGNDYDCTKGTTVTLRCSCGETKTETIKPTMHVLTEYEGRANTCLLDGYDSYVECSNCSYSTFVNIPAPGHQYTDHAAKVPTCTEKGWYAYKTCDVCEYSTYVERPMTSHTFENGYCKCGAKDPNAHFHVWDTGVTTPVTCTIDGYVIYTCQDTNCGQIKKETIPATGHTYEDRNGKAATCTVDGYQAYKICTNANCDGNGIAAPITIPALGHDDIHCNAKSPTCTEFGWNAYSICQRCERSTYVEIPSKGHSFENGYCACGQPDGQHTCIWGEGYVSKAATCSAPGVKTFACSNENCRETKEEAIPVLGHDKIHYNEKAPTCLTNGWCAYDECQRCGYSTFLEIPATGHSYNYSTVTIQPTCTMSGVRTYKCACGASYDIDIDKLGHDWGVWYVTKDATCTTSGQEQRVCLNNSAHTDVRSTSSIGHEWSEYHISKAATCVSMGEEIRYCLHDASHVDIPRKTPMLEHTLNSDGACIVCKQQIKPPLATPEITTNAYSIFWNAVSGAERYELKLLYNGKEDYLSITATSCDLTKYFLECSSVDIQIRAIAAENTGYSNSPYNVLKFEIPNGTIVNHGGIGQSVNILTGSYTDYENGSNISIFNKNVLNRVDVDDYTEQKASHYSEAVYSESLEEYVNRVTEGVNDKMSIGASVGYAGMVKATAGFNYEVGSNYEKKNYNQTQAIFYDIYYRYIGYQTGMKGYLTKIMAMSNTEREAALEALTSVIFRNDAKKLQNGEITPEEFIARYGTHVITEAIYGAKFDAHYERLSTKEEATSTFGEDIKSAITASIAASIYGVDLGLNVESAKTVSSSTFMSNTTSDVHSKFTFEALGGKKPVNMVAMTFAEFSTVCEAWANSITNAEDYDFIDIPNNSLWFVWDFLGDEYSEAKKILNQYFYTMCDAQSDAITAKIASMYKDFFIFDEDTGILTIDLSARQYPNSGSINVSDALYMDGTSEVFKNGKFTIYPKFNGHKIKKVVFKGGYMSNDYLTDQLITDKFSGIYITFDDDWSEDIVVELQNFGYVAPSGKIGMDFSESSSENITIIVNGAAYIQGGNGSQSSGLTGIQAAGKKLTIEGNGNAEVKGGSGTNGATYGASGYNGGIGIAAETIDVNIVGDLRVVGGNGGNGAVGSPGSNGSGNDRPGSSGGNGGRGGNGASGIKCVSINVSDASYTSVYAGNGGTGGNGGRGGDGSDDDAPASDRTGKGGNGGSGGNGGACAKSLDIAESITSDRIKCTEGTVGAGGRGGNGGDGGDSKGWFGGVGADGGSGGIGGLNGDGTVRAPSGNHGAQGA